MTSVDTTTAGGRQQEDPRSESDNVQVVDDELLADIARRYYLADMSKVDIATALGLSRFKVARLLDLAKAQGIVHISISTSSPVNQPLSQRLATRLGLDRCIVVNTTGGAQAAREQVAAAAARVLPGLVKDGDLLGVTWSRTVESMVDMLTDLPHCSVVQLAGSFSTTHGDALDLVHRAARVSGGSAYALHAPLVVDDPTLAAALRRQPGIADTFQIADDVDVSVVAVGAWKPGCSTVWEAVSPSVQNAGLQAGAVGEVTGRLLDVDGASVESPLDHLVLSASLEQLKRPPQRIALVSGPHRAAPTLAAVRAGLVTTLVTTGAVARAILRMTDPLPVTVERPDGKPRSNP